MLKRKTQVKEDARLLAVRTVKELIIRFDKSITEAEKIVKSSDMEKYVLKHPISMHDSPYAWAVKLLLEKGDIEALEKYSI